MGSFKFFQGHCKAHTTLCVKNKSTAMFGGKCKYSVLFKAFSVTSPFCGSDLICACLSHPSDFPFPEEAGNFSLFVFHYLTLCFITSTLS